MSEKQRLYLTFSLLSMFLILITSCNKEDERIEQEKIKLQQYLEQMGYTDVEPTGSGLYYIELQSSEGESPARSDYINFNYTGRLLDGAVVMTSDRELAIENDIERDDQLYGPFKTLLETLPIAGLREGLTMMKEGEIAKFIIPSHLAFGQSSRGIIGPYSTLIYEVELLDVIKDPVEHEQKLLEAYLLENEIDVEAETSGLYYIETREGTGDLPGPDNKIAIHYQGSLIDGRIFEQSADGEPVTVNLNYSVNYIPGLIEGIKKMRIGGEARLIIPSELGFGPSDIPESIIPPYSTLIIDVEIENIY